MNHTGPFAIALLFLLPSLAFATPTISVSGTAEIRVVPDEVILIVAVETRHATLESAKKENDRRLSAALSFLGEQQVPEKEIKTNLIKVEPIFDHDKSIVDPVAYKVRRDIGIRLKQLDRFEHILQELVDLGVNRVKNVVLRTTRLREIRDNARQQAIRAAKEKATALAHELGAELAAVQTIGENTWGGMHRLSGAHNMVQNVVSSAGANGGSLALGQLQVNATVNVTFTMKQTEL